MSLAGKKVAILAADEYEDLELWVPLMRLREEGAEVLVVGPKQGSYSSKHGYAVEADATASEVDPETLDALVIPGGYAPDHMRRHRAMVDLVRKVGEARKPVAAICHGGWMLASAGLVEGRKVTGFFSIADDLRHAGARYVDEEVVRDENLITSRSPDDLPAFCRTLVEALAEQPAPTRRR